MTARPRRDGSLFSARSRRYAALLVSVLVIISAVALSMAPRWLVPHLAARFPGCLYAVETAVQAVALTIDDGPDSLTTPDLLRELRNHGAHATFFLISGNVADGDSTVAAMIAAGHEIGNHLTRDQASISLAPAGFDSAVVSAGRTLSRFGPVRWARPGGGRYNRRMVATMERLGYQCALGSLYPYDAEIASSRFSSAFVLAHVRPGAIIVLHDGGARGRRTTAVLHRLLPELRRRGLRVVTLSELMRTSQRL
jgi:peptidoglycan-N-acetylglucosamine deacetylase